MINKLYDFKSVTIPEALLKATVTHEEIMDELRQTAERFTTIAPASDGISNGDIVVLEIPDEQSPDGVQQVYVNMGKGFFDSEEALLGLCAGTQAEIIYEGKKVCAVILGVKRKNIPELTDGYICRLGINGVSTVAAYENLVFGNKAAQQRQRRMKGIFEIASKAVLAHTEFFPIGDDNEWYRTLYNGTMIQLEAMAQQTGKSVDDIMPEALRMPGKTADECRRAMEEMCEKHVKLGALGLYYARQNGIEYTREESIARIQAYLPQTGLENTAAVNENMLISDIIQRYTEYFQKTISEYYEDKIQVVLQ